ncbi:MAG: YebC/PmpR family DNA-binding transcriptional regulator [Candidatus Pacebacteria bacterium]|nr:YebC/PmpR family DNA-binding transcriptional regulator [Candidatus Paceibacterota bacterium]
MSGHSHAKTVKRVKDANDAARGKIFSKLSRVITLAAREGGSPEFNAKLKSAIDEAKKFNMPKDTIERAVKKGTGELEGEALEAISVEILGPAGVGIIVEGITDNKNRSMGEIKQIAQKRNCKIASEGAVKWQFNQAGIITINQKSDIRNQKESGNLELLAIEVGAIDMEKYQEDGEDFLEITTKPEELAMVKTALEEKGLVLESANLGWVAKEKITVSQNDKDLLEKLFEDLDENDSVQSVYSNLKN